MSESSSEVPSEPTGQPSSEEPSKPAGERYSDWRTDGSAGRFTEPPSRPAAGPLSKPVSDPLSTPVSEPLRGPASKPSGDRWSRPSSDRPGRPSGGPGKSATESVSDLQRWLMKAGARSMANQVADNVRRTLGQPKRDSGDVWDTATTEPPHDEPPECQWCPVCQAARRMRVSGPGIGDRLASVGGVFASVVQDAFSAVDKAIKVQPSAEDPHDKAS